MRTSELAGPALDWAVAKCEGIPAEEIYISGKGKYTSLYRRNRDEDGELDGTYTTGPDLLFSKKWEAGGPIIERERIQFRSEQHTQYRAFMGQFGSEGVGPTHLIAAMRCYVFSKLGDEVDIPEELR